MKKTIKLGFVPTRRGISAEKFCNKEVAAQRKQDIENYIKTQDVQIVDIDFLNQEGMIYSVLDAEKTAKKLIEAQVDAVFVPHCNFGTEDAVAKVCKIVGKPVLLWGPRDESPDPEDGERMTDSQCGLFATGKVLRQYGVPFTYITNSRITDEVFVQGFAAFLKVVAAVKSFTRMRIGQIGTRPKEFLSVKCNELELLEKFGVEIVPITMLDLQDMFQAEMESRKEEINEEVEKFRAACDIHIDDVCLNKTAALKLTLRRWAEQEQLDAMAVMCWDPMNTLAGIRPCFTFSELTGEGIPVACELDIHGAMTSVLLQAASGWNKPSFLADLTMRHPTNDNAELLWHCGVFPKELAKNKPVIEKSFDGKRPAVGSYEICGGTITVARIDADHGHYSMLFGNANGVSGPRTMGTYGWFEFKNWPAWEHKFVTGPYIHHCVGIHGDYVDVLQEVCKYIPALEADPMGIEIENKRSIFCR